MGVYGNDNYRSLPLCPTQFGLLLLVLRVLQLAESGNGYHYGN